MRRNYRDHGQLESAGMHPGAPRHCRRAKWSGSKARRHPGCIATTLPKSAKPTDRKDCAVLCRVHWFPRTEASSSRLPKQNKSRRFHTLLARRSPWQTTAPFSHAWTIDNKWRVYWFVNHPQYIQYHHKWDSNHRMIVVYGIPHADLPIFSCCLGVNPCSYGFTLARPPPSRAKAPLGRQSVASSNVRFIKSTEKKPYRSLISSHPLAELQLYHGVAPTPSHILWTMRLCPHRRTNDFHKFIDWKVSIAPRCCGNSLGMRCSGQMLCHVSAISSRNTESQHWGSRHLDLGPTPVGRRSSILEKLILYINTYILFLLLDITWYYWCWFWDVHMCEYITT